MNRSYLTPWTKIHSVKTVLVVEKVTEMELYKLLNDGRLSIIAILPVMPYNLPDPEGIHVSHFANTFAPGLLWNENQG